MPKARSSTGETVRQTYQLHEKDDDWTRAGSLIREVLDDVARDRFVDTVAGAPASVRDHIFERASRYWKNVDAEIDQRIEDKVRSAPTISSEAAADVVIGEKGTRPEVTASVRKELAGAVSPSRPSHRPSVVLVISVLAPIRPSTIQAASALCLLRRVWGHRLRHRRFEIKAIVDANCRCTMKIYEFAVRRRRRSARASTENLLV